MIIVNTHTHGDVVVISPRGDLNINYTADVEKIFYEQLHNKPKVIGFDLKDLRSLDSSGLGLFMKLQKEAKSSNVESVFYNITGNIVALFDITKMDAYFTVMTGEEFQDTYLR